MTVRAMEWTAAGLKLIEQTLLPDEETWITCTSWVEVADAIRRLAVRGAPAIGCAAAYGVAVTARTSRGLDRARFDVAIREAIDGLAATRPTAVNLFWALDRCRQVLEASSGAPTEEAAAALEAEAIEIHREDEALCRRIGEHGAELIPDGASILTHCNAGALATGGDGTALAVVRAAHAQGKKIRVFSDETRPLLQGARLTVWELMRDGIEVIQICDNMAASLMRRGEIDLAVVGTDRTAANGDVANKIGTYGVAVLCRHHELPLYVALPVSTFDPELSDGSQIPIEERDPSEVTAVRSVRIAPEGAAVRNPAFDVTPNELVTALITDRGVLRPPYVESIRQALGGG